MTSGLVRAHRGLDWRRPTLHIAAIALCVAIGMSGALAADNNAAPAARSWGFADIVEKVKPAVVAVRVKVLTSANQLFDQPDSSDQSFLGRRSSTSVSRARHAPNNQFLAMAQGSGFFVSSDGYVVTNQHVVEDYKSVEVVTDDGKSYPAKVVGSDPKSDLTLIKVDGRGEFPFVGLADRVPRVGEWVITVGNPFGLDGTVTAGIVSARQRDIGAGPYDDFIQIDAPVNKGNSGGPVFDVEGGVIGVNTAIFSPSGGSVGIAFATPSDTVRDVIGQLRAKGTVTRGFIGVDIQPVTADIAESLDLSSAEGALVTEPLASGPAATAGIAAGDIIVAVNDAPIKDSRDLMRRIAALTPGTPARLKFVRNGRQQSATLTVARAPAPPPQTAKQAADGQGERPSTKGSGLGLSLAPADKAAGSAGLVVTEVAPDGRAAERGLDVGDVILDVAGKSLKTPADFHKALAEARNGGRHRVLMRLRSGDKTRFVTLPLG
jgi:serine protease Do